MNCFSFAANKTQDTMALAKFKSWEAYRVSYQLAGRIFRVTASFPKEEKYSLTDQVRRSSRSVCANLAESYAKRYYPKHFKSKLTDCIGENSETQVWLDFALDCHYINQEEYNELNNLAISANKLLCYMAKNMDKY